MAQQFIQDITVLSGENTTFAFPRVKLIGEGSFTACVKQRSQGIAEDTYSFHITLFSFCILVSYQEK